MELPEPVRLRLGNFSRTMFRDSNRTEPEYSEGPGEWPRPGAGSVAAAADPRGFGARMLPGPKMAVSPSAAAAVREHLEERPGPELAGTAQAPGGRRCEAHRAEAWPASSKQGS